MRSRFALAAVLLALVAATVLRPIAPAAAGPTTAPATAPSAASQLVGTWHQTSAVYGGKPAERAPGAFVMRHVTPTQFVDVFYKPAEATVGMTVGGHYTATAKSFTIMVEYTSMKKGIPAELKSMTYNSKLDGDRWVLTGDLAGKSGEEVWERDVAK